MRLSGELILSAALLLCMASNAASVQGQQRVSSEAPVVLSFKEFFVLKNGELTPAPRLLALNGSASAWLALWLSWNRRRWAGFIFVRGQSSATKKARARPTCPWRTCW